MKRLVTAALTAATAAIAGSAIALTPVYAQEVPPEPTPEPSATPAQIRAPASGSNIVVFVIPESVGELTNAACSVDEVAEETSSKSMMRFGKHEQGHTSTTHEISRGARTSDDSEDSDDSIGLPSEACTTLRGLFASLAGLVPQASVTDGATDVAIDDDEGSARTEDEDATDVSETEEAAAPGDDDDAGTDEDEGLETDDDDGTAGALTPTGRTSVYVTIFAGDDAGEGGCTLDELIADASGAVPVVEAGGEVPLQGAADVSDVALPAEVCALLSALFSTAPATGTGTATAPEDEATAMPATSDDAGDASDTEADDNDEADGNDEADDENEEADEADDDEDESSTPAAGSTTTTSSEATATPTRNATATPTGTVTATPTTTSTATPTATGTPEADEADDVEEDAESGGDAP